MPTGKGLLAPQNDFLGAIARRFQGTHSNFVLGNAQAPGHPIVYCSDGFCQLTGYSRAKVMSQNCACQFLIGPDTKQSDFDGIIHALSARQELRVSILFHKSNGAPFRCLLDIKPVKNEKGEVVLLFLSHKEIINEQTPAIYKIGGTSVHRNREALRPSGKANRLSRTFLHHLVGQSDVKDRRFLTKAWTTDEKIALPEYRTQNAHMSRGIILHCDIFKLVWDCLILLCTFYIAITVPYNAAFITLYNTERASENEDDLQKQTLYADIIVELLFITDIILNFRTTFVSESGQVTYDSSAIALNYVKTWFFLDLLAAIPFDLIFMFEVTKNTILPLLKIARLLRLARMMQKFDRFAQYSTAVLALLMTMYALICHWLACIWFVIGYHDLHKESVNWQSGWMYSMAVTLGLPITRANSSNETVVHMPPLKSAYLTSLYFTTTVLTSVGFGNVAANTDDEKIFAVVTMMIGALMHATVFANVVAIIQRMYSRKALFHSKTQDLKEFFKTHRIPKPLRSRINDFFQTTWSTNKGVDPNDILKDFPEELKSDVSMHMYKEVLSLRLFDGISPGCMKMLALTVKTMFSAPSEIALAKGDAVQHIYYICSGSIEILKDDLVVAILGKGDLFGCDVTAEELQEHAVVKSDLTVRSLTYCMLQCMSLHGMAAVMTHYPETVERILQDLRNELTSNLSEYSMSQDLLQSMTLSNLPDMGGRPYQDAHPTWQSDVRRLSLPSLKQPQQPLCDDGAGEYDNRPARALSMSLVETSMNSSAANPQVLEQTTIRETGGQRQRRRNHSRTKQIAAPRALTVHTELDDLLRNMQTEMHNLREAMTNMSEKLARLSYEVAANGSHSTRLASVSTPDVDSVALLAASMKSVASGAQPLLHHSLCLENGIANMAYALDDER